MRCNLCDDSSQFQVNQRNFTPKRNFFVEHFLVLVTHFFPPTYLIMYTYLSHFFSFFPFPSVQPLCHFLKYLRHVISTVLQMSIGNSYHLTSDWWLACLPYFDNKNADIFNSLNYMQSHLITIIMYQHPCTQENIHD